MLGEVRLTFSTDEAMYLTQEHWVKCYGYNSHTKAIAQLEPNRSSSAQILYTTSSLLLLTIVPYSLLFLHPITEKLSRKAHSLGNASLTDTAIESEVAKEETTHALVDKWATLNLGRTVLSALAAVTATWAAVDRLEIVPAVARLGSGAGRMGK